MAAPVVRGILISLGIVAALGYAVYENPEVQQWIEEQRRKLAQLLRNIGDELDPQSRQAAEAYAFGGRDYASNEGAEIPGGGVAVSTGRSAEHAAPVRRIFVQQSHEELEERQRLGQEYLNRRNQHMLEMQERRRAESQASVDNDAEPVNEDTRRIKLESASSSDQHSLVESPLLPATVESPLQCPTLDSSSRPISDLTSPDQIDRSETPRPAVPPKIKLEEIDPAPIIEPESTANPEPTLSMPGSMPDSMPATEGLSYDEQLAIALSISREASNESSQQTRYVDELRQAIEASLQDHGQTHDDPAVSVMEEDLYGVTPNLTRATLATLNAQHPTLIPYTGPHEAAMQSASFHTARTPTEASSFNFSDTESFASIAQADAATTRRSIDTEDQASDNSEDGITTPDSWTEIGSRDGQSDVEVHVS